MMHPHPPCLPCNNSTRIWYGLSAREVDSKTDGEGEEPAAHGRGSTEFKFNLFGSRLLQLHNMLPSRKSSNRPPSSLSLRPPSRNTSRPGSSATQRPTSSLSVRSVQPQSRFSERTHPRYARSRLIPLCQTLVSQITGLRENTEQDADGENFREAVEHMVKALETSTINKAAVSVDMSVIDTRISG